MRAVHPAGALRVSTRRRWITALLVVTALGALARPPAALAHLRTGTIAVDYRATITARRTAAYSAAIAQADHTVRLTVAHGHVITVLGYLGEPMLRLDGDVVLVNIDSPTALSAGLVPRHDARSAGPATFIKHADGATVSWRDSRAQQLPAGVDAGGWSIPLLIDGRRATLTGALRRYPPPSLLAWGLLLAGLLACGTWVAALRRPEVIRAAATGCALLGAVACPVLALGFALDGDASPGTWIEGFNEIVFAAVGLIVLARGHELARAAATIGLGLVSLAVGLLDSPVFLHAIVLSLLPAALTRTLVVLVAGAGLASVGLGAVGFAHLLPASLEVASAGHDHARA